MGGLFGQTQEWRLKNLIIEKSIFNTHDKNNK